MPAARTISEQIRTAAALKLTDKEYRNKALVRINNDRSIIMNTTSVLMKYRSTLMKFVQKYEINGVDALKYEYKPTYLAYKLYGTVEMAPFILEINHMISASEFTGLEKGIYLFSGGAADVLNEVMIKEESELRLNQEELETDLASLA